MIFFVSSLGGHAHPRCLVYEPKTPFTVYKKSLENWRGWCGLFVQIQNPHDFKRGLSKYEFDGLRLNCGHVGRPCGKFVYIDFFVNLFVYFCLLADSSYSGYVYEVLIITWFHEQRKTNSEIFANSLDDKKWKVHVWKFGIRFSFFRETVVYDVVGSSIMMLIVVFNVCYECSMLDQPRETTLFKGISARQCPH